MSEVNKLKKETIRTAERIQAELKELQLKFPAYIFQPLVQVQKLGPNNFYKVTIKTYVNEISNGKPN